MPVDMEHSVSEFELECGRVLHNVPVAYKTWGHLNAEANNVMVICHALSGSADVEDWYVGTTFGTGRAFDPSRFFIFCGNVLGSPYGTASPCTNNPQTGLPYGSDFPLVSIRDDVRLHKLLLDKIGVSQIAVCIGGSMGGMQVLEWAACFGSLYVKTWGISWGETQRRTIASDPKYRDGKYTREDPPHEGLAAARMTAMLTYRSRNSFEARFGRRRMEPRTTNSNPSSKQVFSAQSYLEFDANCYVTIIRKMDSHDIARDRGDYTGVLAKITQPALVLGVESDGLFTINEQYELAELLPNAEMAVIQSPDGHDGFLLEFDQLNRHILTFLRRTLPNIAPPISSEGGDIGPNSQSTEKLKATKTSLFGEAEADVISW
ncbi:Alpha/Beta hydrolase protein [Syncephalis plumigaleata]|nr:Alpha/Beta hydrolase protein [Syncephalis plumigaleata]